MSSTWRASYYVSKQEFYEFYVSLLVQMHQRVPSAGYDAVAVHASERARARGLLELLAEANVDVHEGIAPELKQREKATQTRIAAIQRQLIQAHSPPSPHQARIAALEQELKKADDEREQLEMEIRQKHLRYAEIHYPTPLRLKAIQELLDQQTALLEYFLGDETSVLFAVSQTDFLAVRLPSTSVISHRVRALRRAISTGPRRGLPGLSHPCPLALPRVGSTCPQAYR